MVFHEAQQLVKENNLCQRILKKNQQANITQRNTITKEKIIIL